MDINIVEGGAWLHDTALPSGDDYDYEKNKAIVTALLRDFRLSDEDSDAIAECVASHEGTARSKTLEAKIVHDADVLEKSGLLGVIRHTWKLTNLGRLVPERITRKDAERILAHLTWRSARLHTPLARKMRAHVNVRLAPHTALELIRIAALKAAEGVVTERIARSVNPMLSKKQQNKLREQLNQRYLRRF